MQPPKNSTDYYAISAIGLSHKEREAKLFYWWEFMAERGHIQAVKNLINLTLMNKKYYIYNNIAFYESDQNPFKLNQNKSIKMNITCINCHNTSELKDDDEEFINSMLAIGLKVVMIECPICHEKTAFSADKNINMNIPKQDFIVKCPIPNCNGWVTHIFYPEHNEDFYGCGECSSIWKTKKELEKYISKQ